ncbi:MAG: AGE family epimerase/isomerase [Spirochaetales bacterium]|nr:AGE family epimerase/isomerase [Spirochaetales bacterium]
MMSRFSLRDRGALREFYRVQLLEDCVPFWLEHSLDRSFGGYLTMLERDGSPYGTGKYLWPQGREAYMFAKLCNAVEPRVEWLEASRLGVEFLARFALDEDGHAYTKLTREGEPLYSRPAEIFAEAFVVLAFAEYAKASGREEYLHKAERLYWSIVERLQSGELDVQPGVRRAVYREHAPGMILINTTQELRALRDDPRYTELIRGWVHEELYTFARDEQQAMFERVLADGGVDLSEPEGRSVTPGHCLESAWFCLREGVHLQDRGIVERSCRIMEWTMRRGWDPVHGGLFNFVDFAGKPPGHQDEDWGESQDWDAKLFWPHAEGLYALLLAYDQTGDEALMSWYERLHYWSFKYFPDPRYGEWYGYLRRDGSVSQTLKGCVKGFFHIPRAFLNCYLLLSEPPGSGEPAPSGGR